MSNRNYTRQPGALALPAPPFRIAGEFFERLLAGLAMAMRRSADAQARRRRARETVRFLAALSDRDLKDLGLNRSEILSIAFGPADGRRVDANADD